MRHEFCRQRCGHNQLMAGDLTPLADSTVRLLREGYGWLPNRWRRTEANAIHTRLMGRRAVALCGPDAARFFYDENHIRRNGAIPGLVQQTLFGRGTVHTLDGERHRQRKALSLSLLTTPGVADMVEHANTAWSETVDSWMTGRPVVLFDEAGRALTLAASRWAGIPLPASDTDAFAADLVAMVDGFATLGPRHWRARLVRHRRESWLAALIERARDGDASAPAGRAVNAVAAHRDSDGRLLDLRTAAVELLNLVRPTVAVCWFVAYAAHALHRWPEQREALRAGDRIFAEAFAHEVRRFYPFVPFIAGRAVKDTAWRGTSIPGGSLVLLDLYGHNHDVNLWQDPYVFRPQRFLERQVGAFDLVPQGAGDPRTGHRCPGEDLTVALLQSLSMRLARLDYDVPDQDLTISLRRVPARPRSGFLLTPVRAG